MTIVCNAKSFTNIYVGYGLKANSKPCFPMQPENVSTDPKDTNEEHEPNPKSLPKKAEDDEKKEGQDDQKE